MPTAHEHARRVELRKASPAIKEGSFPTTNSTEQNGYASGEFGIARLSGNTICQSAGSAFPYEHCPFLRSIRIAHR